MTAIIQINALTKSYKLRPAVDDLNLTVEEGELFGFVGPNGAGKTTTIRIMSTLLEPSHGDILVAGHSVRHAMREVRQLVGYMPDVFGIYNDLLVWEYLAFFAACYHIPNTLRLGIIKDLLELVDLSHRRDDPVESLSRGMKQRLSLARTLIHDPQVLVLDEPASGLDPRARVEIRELLVELARMGKTVFFSTHILADVAEICTRVGILEAGRLVAVGSLDELQRGLVPHRRVNITLLDKAQAAMARLQQLPGVISANELIEDHQPTLKHIELNFQGDDNALSGILSALVQEGIPVVEFTEPQRDLEEIFMRTTQGLVT
jgi:ABC-2 type transport system ATP-binding protein